MRGIISIASSHCSCSVARSFSNACCSTSDDDLPEPQLTRPPERMSSVAIALGDADRVVVAMRQERDAVADANASRCARRRTTRRSPAPTSANTRRARDARPPTRSDSRARRRAPPARGSRGTSAPPWRASARRSASRRRSRTSCGARSSLDQRSNCRVASRSLRRLGAAKARRRPLATTNAASASPSTRILPVSCAVLKSVRPARRS